MGRPLNDISGYVWAGLCLSGWAHHQGRPLEFDPQLQVGHQISPAIWGISKNNAHKLKNTHKLSIDRVLSKPAALLVVTLVMIGRETNQVWCDSRLYPLSHHEMKSWCPKACLHCDVHQENRAIVIIHGYMYNYNEQEITLLEIGILDGSGCVVPAPEISISTGTLVRLAVHILAPIDRLGSMSYRGNKKGW